MKLKSKEIQQLQLAKSKKVEKCKGLFFRYTESSYFLNGKSIGVGVKKSMTLLKRMSCPGCSQCHYLLEFLKDDISFIDNDYLGEKVDKGIYKLEISGGIDYWTGESDYEALFIRQKEKE